VDQKVTLRSHAALALAAICLCGCHRSPAAPSEVSPTETILIQGTTRTYVLHVPSTFRSGSGALVLALHGRTESGAFFENFTKLDTVSDREGFIVAYPEGLFQPVNGAVNWAFYRNDYVDDVSFLKGLITSLQARFDVDPKHIYVTGFSSGGFMAYRAAIELSDLIAAVGVVGGRLFREEGGAPANVPPAKGPVSVMMMQGEFDTPYCGGFEVDALGRAYNASQDETFDYWASSNGNNCSTFDTAEPLCRDGVQTAVTSKSATNCRANTQVTFHKLLGGQHFWYTDPMNRRGQLPFNPELTDATGVTTNDIIWNFFKGHSR
jgi:polyhydroxybutyrate depolymerase